MGVRRAGREFFGDTPPPPHFLELRILKDLGNAWRADFGKVREGKELAGFCVYSQRTIA